MKPLKIIKAPQHILFDKHPKCGGVYYPFENDYGCEYNTTLTCEDCKYGMGRKDPVAKRNQLKNERTI